MTNEATHLWMGHRVRLVGTPRSISGGMVQDVVNVGGYLDGLSYGVLPEQLEPLPDAEPTVAGVEVGSILVADVATIERNDGQYVIRCTCGARISGWTGVLVDPEAALAQAHGHIAAHVRSEYPSTTDDEEVDAR